LPPCTVLLLCCSHEYACLCIESRVSSPHPRAFVQRGCSTGGMPFGVAPSATCAIGRRRRRPRSPRSRRQPAHPLASVSSYTASHRTSTSEARPSHGRPRCSGTTRRLTHSARVSAVCTASALHLHCVCTVRVHTASAAGSTRVYGAAHGATPHRGRLRASTSECPRSMPPSPSSPSLGG
jgi:hypothetical protein